MEFVFSSTCSDGFEKAIKHLLDRGAEVEKIPFSKWSPLYSAIRDKRTSFVDLLLERGCRVNTLRDSGYSALHAAAEYADVKMFELILERGAKIDQKDERGRTPFFFAVKRNNTPVVEYLIKTGINVNATDNKGRTPLHSAAKKGHPELVKMLLTAGSKVDVHDKYGETPLFLTSYSNHNSVVLKMLLDRGARINIKNIFGSDPLFGAIKTAKFEHVESLLNAGACIDFTNIAPRNSSFYHKGYITNGEYDIVKTKEVLKTYLMTRLAAKISVDASRIITIFQLDASDCKLLRESCILELEKMESKKFGSISLRDVFIKTNDPTFADNTELEAFINSYYLAKEFPNYAAALRLKFKEAKKRNDLLKFSCFDMKTNVKGIITIVLLPNEIKRKIFCYLSNKELEILKMAFQDSN